LREKSPLAALRDDRPVSELASQFGVHSTVIGRWKREALASMEAGFSGKLDVQQNNHALEEAFSRHGQPEIFNTDQGSQFTSFDFTSALKDKGIKISMDGKGRWMDNVFIERLWRSLKYECVYLNAFENGLQARQNIGAWLAHYNQTRPHSTFNGARSLPLGYKPPMRSIIKKSKIRGMPLIKGKERHNIKQHNKA